MHLLGAGMTSGTYYFVIDFPVGDTINIYEGNPSPINFQLYSTQVFRDPSAWYHIVLAADTTQATAANRMKLYVNGVQVTSFSTANYPSQNSNLYYNQNGFVKGLGNSVYNGAWGSSNFDGQIAEHYFIDGQALTPSSFGSTNALTGVWQPAKYTGTYGTNGFYLPFTDNSALTTSSNVGLGKDFSGNGNYWVTNNISITSGVTYDSMTDVPTLTSATAANFAVLNPLNTATGSFTLANGNLQFTATATNASCVGTVIPTSGKWYAEAIFTTGGGSYYSVIGVVRGNTTAQWYTSGGGVFYESDAYKRIDGTATAYGVVWNTGDVLGIAVDIDGGTVTFYVNNSSQGAISLPSSTSGWTFSLGDSHSGGGSVGSINFGQRPFTYTPPTGYVALNTYNLPTPTILAGNKYMDATLYNGNGTTGQSVANAQSFKPDLVWVKARNGTGYNVLYDSVRGAFKQLASNNTNAETTPPSGYGVTAFNSNGFSVLDTNAGDWSVNGASGGTYSGTPPAYVGWQWQAGQGTTSSNTSGSITSTVSVNATAGFSVVTYTAPATNTFTVGHGLGVTPSMIIVKGRNQPYNWDVYHVSLGATGILHLNTTQSFITTSGPWNNTAPTSSIFTSSSNGVYYNSGDTLVAYCFAPIAGYSSFGSYSGNGSTDGPFIFTGFRPKFVLIKMTSSTGDWYLYDSSRDPYNATQQGLLPNSSASETTYTGWGDLLSNGFKIRRTDAAWNSSGGSYIYAAFAENPLKYSLAR
jgi:hypothetical protein